MKWYSGGCCNDFDLDQIKNDLTPERLPIHKRRHREREDRNFGGDDHLLMRSRLPELNFNEDER